MALSNFFKNLFTFFSFLFRKSKMVISIGFYQVSLILIRNSWYDKIWSLKIIKDSVQHKQWSKSWISRHLPKKCKEISLSRTKWKSSIVNWFDFSFIVGKCLAFAGPYDTERISIENGMSIIVLIIIMSENLFLLWSSLVVSLLPSSISLQVSLI